MYYVRFSFECRHIFGEKSSPNRNSRSVDIHVKIFDNQPTDLSFVADRLSDRLNLKRTVEEPPKRTRRIEMFSKKIINTSRPTVQRRW